MSSNDDVADEEVVAEPSALTRAIRLWIKTVGPFWAASIAGHLAALIILALVLGSVQVVKKIMDAPEFEAEVETQLPSPTSKPSKSARLRWSRRVLEHESLMLESRRPWKLRTEAHTTIPMCSSRRGRHGLGHRALISVASVDSTIKPSATARPLKGRAESVPAPAPATPAAAAAKAPASAAAARDIARAILGAFGGTKQSEPRSSRGIELDRSHQGQDGGWTLDQYTIQCKDSTCTGAGKIKSNAAAVRLCHAAVPGRWSDA